MADVFRKNVSERRWEATYKIGKSVQIMYFRSESEYSAMREAKEKAIELCAELIDFHPLGESGNVSDNQIWGEHDAYMAEIERLRKLDKTRPLSEIVDEILAREQTVEKTDNQNNE